MKIEITLSETGLQGINLAPFVVDFPVPDMGTGVVGQLVQHILIGKEFSLDVLVEPVAPDGVRTIITLVDNVPFLPGVATLFDQTDKVGAFLSTELGILTGQTGASIMAKGKVVA